VLTKPRRTTLQDSPISKFKLGPKGVYIINGSKNVQAVLRNSGNLSSDELFFMAIQQLDAVTKDDVQKFKNDKSGRSHIAVGNVKEEDRLWAPNHRLFIDYLASPQAVQVMSKKFYEMFEGVIGKREKGQWEEVRLYKFLQTEMVECAITSLSGSEILKMNPGFIDAMWKFDAGVYPLALGIPKFLYKKAYVARDAFHEMGEKWMKYAWEKYDWSGPDVDWDPIFGARFSRIHSKFLKDREFDMRSRVGMHLGSTWAYDKLSVSR
jgi:hypothetical protein